MLWKRYVLIRAGPRVSFEHGHDVMAEKLDMAMVHWGAENQAGLWKEYMINGRARFENIYERGQVMFQNDGLLPC